MTTDVHSLPTEGEPPRGVVLFWSLVIIAVLAAMVQPFWPPRALSDSTHEIQ